MIFDLGRAVPLARGTFHHEQRLSPHGQGDVPFDLGRAVPLARRMFHVTNDASAQRPVRHDLRPRQSSPSCPAHVLRHGRRPCPHGQAARSSTSAEQFLLPGDVQRHERRLSPHGQAARSSTSAEQFLLPDARSMSRTTPQPAQPCGASLRHRQSRPLARPMFRATDGPPPARSGAARSSTSAEQFLLPAARSTSRTTPQPARPGRHDLRPRQSSSSCPAHVPRHERRLSPHGQCGATLALGRAVATTFNSHTRVPPPELNSSPTASWDR